MCGGSKDMGRGVGLIFAKFSISSNHVQTVIHDGSRPHVDGSSKVNGRRDVGRDPSWMTIWTWLDEIENSDPQIRQQTCSLRSGVCIKGAKD